jgi:hypothetical protein
LVVGACQSGSVEWCSPARGWGVHGVHGTAVHASNIHPHCNRNAVTSLECSGASPTGLSPTGPGHTNGDVGTSRVTCCVREHRPRCCSMSAGPCTTPHGPSFCRVTPGVTDGWADPRCVGHEEGRWTAWAWAGTPLAASRPASPGRATRSEPGGASPVALAPPMPTVENRASRVTATTAATAAARGR